MGKHEEKAILDRQKFSGGENLTSSILELAEEVGGGATIVASVSFALFGEDPRGLAEQGSSTP